MPGKIAVIGAGISGLSTANALLQAGHQVAVFEASPRAGGPVSSASDGGYLTESGPHTLLVRSLEVHRMLERLGLTDRIVDADEVASRRYVVKDGRPTALPSSPMEAVTTPLLSPAARLRILAEPLIGRLGDAEIDETLAHFVTRRLGAEVLEYLVDPFVGGIWAGDPRQLSARHAFPTLKEWEDSAGSILLGAIKSIFGKIRNKEERVPRRLLSFEGGMQTLIDALVKSLGDALYLDSPLRKIRRDDDGWRVIYQRGKARQGKTFDAVILTIPTYHLPDLEWENAAPPRGRIDDLSNLPYAPCTLATLGFRREDVEHPLDGLGILVPRVEDFHILGALFVSSMFPQRAPRGFHQITTFIGGARQPELAFYDDEDIIEMVSLDLGRLLGIDVHPEFSRITRYERAIPQYEVGHQTYLDAIDDIETQLPGIFFAGNYRDGIGVPALLEASLTHAERLEDFLAHV